MAGWIDREKIGTVTRSDGTQFSVHLLKIGDLRGMNVSVPDFPFDLAAKAMNITREEFDEWDVSDALKAIEMAGNGMTKL